MQNPKPKIKIKCILGFVVKISMLAVTCVVCTTCDPIMFEDENFYKGREYAHLSNDKMTLTNLN